MAAKIDYADLKIEPYETVFGESTFLFDIDGTLALHGDNRGIHDYDKVGTDGVNLPVFALLYQLKVVGNNIVLLSGRPDSCYEQTNDWLAEAVENIAPYTPVLTQLMPNNDIDVGIFAHKSAPWWDLYMRTAGDYRPDYQVKLEIFNEKIRHQYNITGVFDDRDQCVRLWRDLGLTCYQVAYGDF